MTWRSVVEAVLAACLMGLSPCPAAVGQDAAPDASPPQAADTSIQYLPLGAPPGMSQAVIVQGRPLVHTRQLLPLDPTGNLVGQGAVEQQIEQVLDNLDAVLTASGSGLRHLVRLNVYAITPLTVVQVREQLSARVGPAVRPAITAVLTPMPHPQALVAVDAVAVSTEESQAVVMKRCEAVSGDPACADAAVLPCGGVAFLSGVPKESDVAVPAVTKSMSTLLKTLQLLQLSPADIVQLKVFLRPASSAQAVLHELNKFFPDQLTPPVVFIEWIAVPQIEIEMIARLPPAARPAEPVQYFTPPDVRPAPTFSRVALVGGERLIYVSGLFARQAGRGEEQARDLFAQLQIILNETGSDMLHLAKATYFVCDADASRGFDVVRPIAYDPLRPPAASLLMVHGVGQEGRTLTMDMIAVGK